MISRATLILATVSVVALGVAVSSTAFMIDASGESPSQITDKPKVPRYSETCAHGHNGFNCEPYGYLKDIKDLQERVTKLEKGRY